MHNSIILDASFQSGTVGDSALRLKVASATISMLHPDHAASASCKHPNRRLAHARHGCKHPNLEAQHVQALMQCAHEFQNQKLEKSHTGFTVVDNSPKKVKIRYDTTTIKMFKQSVQFNDVYNVADLQQHSGSGGWPALHLQLA